MRAARWFCNVMLGISVVLIMPALAVSEEKHYISPPAGTPKRPVGMGAIGIRPGASPPFSAEDVLNYLNSHQIPKVSIPPGQLKVNSLEFITAAAAGKRLNRVVTGLKDDEIVGFAIFSGNLTVSGPPGGNAAKFDRGYAVFDAETGNLLTIGTL
jgi:hypothetical protein